MIPTTMIGLLSDTLSRYFSRSDIISIMMSAGAGGVEPCRPDGREYNKSQLTIEWLNRVNRDNPASATVVLGRVLMSLLGPNSRRQDPLAEFDNAAIHATLSESGLRYMNGSIVSARMSGGATPTLEQSLRSRDFPAVLEEFTRSTQNIETEPREAVSAASNILEAVCKEYITQHPTLQLPSDQSLNSVYKVVRNDLGLDPALVADADLKRVLGGAAAIVDGIAALRTHASSAHAQNTSAAQYRLTPRLARLAVHSAHSIVVFIMDTWEQQT